MKWTDRKVRLLVKLWLAGESAGKIARRFGGISRNSVLGKVYRLRVSGVIDDQQVRGERK
tara:strand:+ start:3662 stop:3841 length:180 start_codon:yes stop_codon:yes gene_type:complete